MKSDHGEKWVLLWDMSSVHTSAETQSAIKAKYPNVFQILIPPTLQFRKSILDGESIETGLKKLRPCLARWVHCAFTAMVDRPRTHAQAWKRLVIHEAEEEAKEPAVNEKVEGEVAAAKRCHSKGKVGF